MEGLKKKKPKFNRVDWNRKPRFNSGNKKFKWRRAAGRDSKIREGRKGRSTMPSVGYMAARSIRGLINGMKPVMVHNVSELSRVGKGEVAVISTKVGNRKKVDIANASLKLSLKFLNFDPKKFLEDLEKKKAEKKKAVKKEKKTEEKKVEKKEEKKESKKEEKPKETKGEKK